MSSFQGKTGSHFPQSLVPDEDDFAFAANAFEPVRDDLVPLRKSKKFSSNPSYNTLMDAVANMSGYGGPVCYGSPLVGWYSSAPDTSSVPNTPLFGRRSRRDRLESGFVPLSRTYSLPQRKSDDTLQSLQNSARVLQEDYQTIDARPSSAEDGADAPETIEDAAAPPQIIGDAPNPLSMCITYGMINAVICLPVMMSFGNIIYRDIFFLPYLPKLVKLVVFSSVVHQISFSTLSGLPFAVGQVQDAGLIFLSAIATSLIRHCQKEGYDDASVLATVTIGLPLCTVCLGGGLVLIGKLRVAGYVEYLPMPVVGGYLAFIGFFCGQAGLAMMGNVEVTGIADWYRFADRDAFLHLLPGLLGGAAVYLTVRKIGHMAVLPLSMLAILLAFYAVLFVTDTSVEMARDQGWVSPLQASEPWYTTWEYLDFSKVVWSALPSQTLTLLSMTVVVALSSGLDVAAIELELGHPLDFNHELKTVGASNVLSGLLGGYTGSYIFSQSIMSLRAGIRSRTAGFVTALTEILVVLLPFPLIAYIPEMFFGSILVMIAIDLMHEWIWALRKKVSSSDYCIALFTFCVILGTNIEVGILGGCLVHVSLVGLRSEAKEMTPKRGEGQELLPDKSQENNVYFAEEKKEGDMDLAYL